MVMTQDDVGDAGEIDFQVTRIVQYGLRAESGVEQNFPTVDFYQRGETPLAHSLVRQHGGQDGDLE